MKHLATLTAAAGLTLGAALVAPTAGSALPLAAPGAAPATQTMIVEAQYSRHRHRYYYRDRGWNNGAVIGGAAALGILGAAAAASASPYYGGYGCYLEQRPVYDQWGRYIGARNVRVCP